MTHDELVAKAWLHFQMSLSLTDDNIEDIGAIYADEMGCIHDDSHVDFGRDIQREVLKRLAPMTHAAQDVLDALEALIAVASDYPEMEKFASPEMRMAREAIAEAKGEA